MTAHLRVLAFLGLLPPCLLGAQQPGSVDCSRALVVDIARRSVAGFDLDVSDSVLVATLPRASLRRVVDTLEGEPSVAYDITLCGHTVHLGWNGFTVSDSALTTKDGLRVGMPIGRFDAAWGKGQLIYSEAGYIRYYLLDGISVNLGVDNCVSFPESESQPVLRRDCPAAFLWISAGRRVGSSGGGPGGPGN
jgi:hypothetical protein